MAGRPKRSTNKVDTRVDSQVYEILGQSLVKWGYQFNRKGQITPSWGAFLEAIASGVIADDGENIVIKIPYKKGLTS